MQQLFVYRGSAPHTVVDSLRFERGVPRPLPYRSMRKINPDEIHPWEPGDPARKGRPIYLRFHPYLTHWLWSRLFVAIVRQQYPTCPIWIIGASPSLSPIWDGIPDVQVIKSPNRNQLKGLISYDCRSGVAKISYSRPTLLNQIVGYSLATQFGLIEPVDVKERPEWLPKPYPDPPKKPKGKHICVVESVPVAKNKIPRQWYALGQAATAAFEKAGHKVEVIRGADPERFPEDWQKIQDAWFVVCAGESPYAFAAAILGKYGRTASYEDGMGWAFRGQLSHAKGIGGEHTYIKIQADAPVNTAERIADMLVEDAELIKQGKDPSVVRDANSEEVALQPVGNSGLSLTDSAPDDWEPREWQNPKEDRDDAADQLERIRSRSKESQIEIEDNDADTDETEAEDSADSSEKRATGGDKGSGSRTRRTRKSRRRSDLPDGQGKSGATKHRDDDDGSEDPEEASGDDRTADGESGE